MGLQHSDFDIRNADAQDVHTILGWQAGQWDAHIRALGKHDGEGLPPVPLPCEQPVPQLEVYLPRARATLFQPPAQEERRNGWRGRIISRVRWGHV